MMRWKMAFRNLFRNRRRTALNVCMISGAVAAIVVFEGFALNLVLGLREMTIRTQTGHLQLATPLFWSKRARSPKQALVPQSKDLISRIARQPNVRYAVGKLSFYGLISRGEVSLSAKGISFDPKAEGAIADRYPFLTGKGFGSNDGFKVAIGSGLATKLGSKPGDRLTVLTQTYDGVVNALDLELVGVFQTAIAEFDDNTFLIPLLTAQRLLDTDRVEQVIVGLDRTENTDAVLHELENALGSSIELQPWYKLAKLYNQVAGFNRVQNRVVEFIILSLILLAILNTVGMSIFERTGEIGTMAALGETRKTIVQQFVTEGFLLGVLGSLAGVVAGIVAIWLINAAKIEVIMPGASTAFHVEIQLYAAAFCEASLLAMMAATFAAFVPAIRASRLNIADALRRNI